MKTLRIVNLSFALAIGLLLAPNLRAQFVETEANDTKATANPFTLTGTGNTITGNTTGASTVTPGAASADNFLLTMPTAVPGIYRNRLVITTVGHSGSIRGLAQTTTGITAGSDVSIQSSSTTTTPPRFNQWYGFGAGEQLIYRVTGTASTTSDYVATLEQSVVTPAAAPSTFIAGSITISSLGQTATDTTLLVLGTDFLPIPGFRNDDTVTSAQSTLTRDYTPGTYTVAISNFNMTANYAAPADESFKTYSVLDFPNIIANSNTTAGNLDLDFTITDSTGTPVAITAVKAGPFDVTFVTFTVVPEPVGLVCLGALAVAAAVRRRRTGV